MFTNSLAHIDQQRNHPKLLGLAIPLGDEEDMTVGECCHWFRQRYFTREKLRRRLPFLSWLPNYSVSDLKGDVIAGISVAFTIVPQGLALAGLAGLPAQYGLYTSFMGCFVYALLGSCKDVAVGPTSIMAVIIYPYVMTGGVQYSILLSFLAGCIQFLFGALNLGFIVDFISFPVISSFSSAAALTIIASQLKLLFGMKYSATRFPDTLAKFFNNFTSINIWDTIMGAVCLFILIPLQYGKDYRFGSAYDQKKNICYKILNSLWVMLVTARNAIIVLVCTLIAAHNFESGFDMFTLTGEIQTGLPVFNWPPFSIDNNSTSTQVGEIFSDLGTGIFAVALIGLMESIAVAKAFETKKTDATQEMIALGMCNIMGSFFGAFPATGAFSRSAVNHNSGVRTPFGGVVTGALVLLSLGTMAPYFQYIPQTVLATIIMTAIIFMIRPSDAIMIWQTSKLDILPYLATFVICLLVGLEYGILAGIFVSLVILLYQMARPKVFIVTKSTPHGYPFLYVKPDRSVFFPSIEYMKVKINKELPDSQELSSRFAIVIDGEHMFRADSTFAIVSQFKLINIFTNFSSVLLLQGIKNMISSFSSQKVLTIFYNLRRTVFRAVHGVSIPPNEFHNCRSEEEVYRVIQSHNKARLLRSQSNVETILTQSTGSTRQNWATQSVDVF